MQPVFYDFHLNGQFISVEVYDSYFALRLLNIKETFWYNLTGLLNIVYRNDPKFSDRYTWANSADQDQT